VSTAYTAGRTSLRTALIMVTFTALFTAAMASVYGLTRPAIRASADAARLKLIDEVLAPGSYDNRLLDDVLKLGPTPALGLDEGGKVYRARKGGAPVAAVIEAAAPDGYGGGIALVVAVGADGRLSGVRSVEHRETPGLGDYIDPRKDKNRRQPWIDGFRGLSFADVAPGDWKVKKDGGHFDYHSGATISARAVTNAVARAMNWAAAQGDALFAAPAKPGKPE
jgi:electron transport complex protein RnfG